MDSREFEELEEDLWIGLNCICMRCRNMLDLEHLEELCDKDTLAWAHAAAKIAYPLGWRVRNETLLCPECASKG